MSLTDMLQRIPPADERTPAGKFAPGNKGGPGSPSKSSRSRAKRIRTSIVRNTKSEDIDAIARVVIDSAKKGERWAVLLFYDRAAGRVASEETSDRLDDLASTVAALARKVQS